MNQLFSKDEVKAINAYKGSLYAVATDEGLVLVVRSKDLTLSRVMRTVIPVKLRDKKSYFIDDENGIIRKLVEKIDFEKADIVYDGDTPFLTLNGKGFKLVDVCASAKGCDLNISPDDYSHVTSFSAGDVERMKRVVCCVSDDDLRPQMSGVHVDANDGTIVATDGRRMAYVKNDRVPDGIADYAGTVGDLIIPEYAVAVMEEGPAKIYWDCYDDANDGGRKSVFNHLLLETGDKKYLFNPVEGRFPNYKRVIPDFSASRYNELTFDFKALKEYEKTGSNDTGRVKFADGKCTQEYEGMTLELDAYMPLPAGVALYINVFYLQDAEKIYGKGEHVEIAFPDPVSYTDENGSHEFIQKALDIKNKDGSVHYVIMPQQHA